MNSLDKVHEFHYRFNRPINDRPTVDVEEVNKLRVRLLREEVDELETALDKRDKVGVLDALTDIQYILDGSYWSFGMGHLKDRAFDIVHEANMAKLGLDGKPIIREDGKILKPEGWQPPQLKHLVYP